MVVVKRMRSFKCPENLALYRVEAADLWLLLTRVVNKKLQSDEWPVL